MIIGIVKDAFGAVDQHVLTTAGIGRGNIRQYRPTNAPHNKHFKLVLKDCACGCAGQKALPVRLRAM